MIRCIDSSVASQPESAVRDGNQNRSVRAAVASVRRATYRNHSSGVFRPHAVLDGHRLRIEAIGVQGLLQFAS